MLTAQEPPDGGESDVRAHLRYARMSVAMALAEATYRSAPRGRRTARARGVERDEFNFATGLTTPPPRRQARCTSGWTTTWTCLPPGRHLSRRCGRRWGMSGTVAAASSFFSMSQCRQRVENWWRCRTSCLSSSSRTLTCQFMVVWSTSHSRRQCFGLHVFQTQHH